MKYLIKKARPTILKLLFLIVMVALIGYPLTIYSDWIMYLLIPSFLVMAFTLVVNLYQFFLADFPRVIETKEDVLEISYESNKKEEVPYSSISSALVSPSPSFGFDKYANIHIFHGKGKVKTFQIQDNETAKKIAKDIESGK